MQPSFFLPVISSKPNKIPGNQNHENMKHVVIFIVFFLMLGISSHAQNLTQVIRGKVVDIDSKSPLVGVALVIEGTNPPVGAITDAEGNFQFSELPIGRYNIDITCMGYENKAIPNLLLGAGKELLLDVSLTESIKQIDEVVVLAKKNKGEPLNDMATVSARSITVEETQRFAGSFNDPSRLVSSYSGVMSDPSGNNDIIIRGNSPRGLQWRVEGVDVPNPNHFANEGATGGPISILNNTTLGDCDFFSGAFPADYGDSYSGVFDVHLRKGNNQESEYTAQIGVIGADLTAEGPILSRSQASYLINYRYSSLDLLNRVGVKVAGDAVPKFQDMTFNVNVPTEKFGTFQFFGIGGLSNISFEEIQWKQNYSADLGILGFNHIYPISEQTYLKTSLSLTSTFNDWDYYESDSEPITWEARGSENFFYKTWALSSQITHKFSAKHTIKAGVTGKLLQYNLKMKVYDYEENVLYTRLKDDGQSELFQSFVSWKYRPVERLTFNTGMHYKYLFLNGDNAIEPRIGVRWQMTPRQALTAAAGLHSKTDNISLYLMLAPRDDGSVVQQNKNLDFLRARHYVLGYEYRLNTNLNLKSEVYYQQLYNVPVAINGDSTFSILNASDGYILGKLVNEGTGRTYGMELTLDKYFSKNYYFLITTSLFESKYTPIDGIERNSEFNNNYIFNLVGGKEFPIGHRQHSSINVNVRSTYAGGQWYTPIDVDASREKNTTIYQDDLAYTERRPDYIRCDLKIAYRRNKNKTTRVWEIDIQNVTNALNVTGDYWDNEKQEVVTYTQMGILPVLNYRIEF
jgi:hypothetical protein